MLRNQCKIGVCESRAPIAAPMRECAPSQRVWQHLRLLLEFLPRLGSLLYLLGVPMMAASFLALGVWWAVEGAGGIWGLLASLLFCGGFGAQCTL